MFSKRVFLIGHNALRSRYQLYMLQTVLYFFEIYNENIQH